MANVCCQHRDYRFTNAPRQQYVESHSDDVTEVLFLNPSSIAGG